MPALNPMSVFVTGATTPVGREVVRQLAAAGYTVSGATENSTGAVQVRTDGGLPAYPDPTRAGELRSAINAAAAGIVVHVEPQRENVLPFARPAWNNRALIDSASAVAAASKEAGVIYIVHTSSILAGLGTDGEHAPPADLSARVAALKAAENAILNSGISAAVLRFGAVYSPEADELRTLNTALMSGRAVNVGEMPASGGHGHAEHGSGGHGDHHAPHTGFVHVADAARAVVLAVQKQVSGVTLDIVDDKSASPAEFASYFAQTQGLTLASSSSSPLRRALAPAAPASAKLHQAVLALHLHADSSAAKSTLDWSPRFSTYRQGIDDLLLSWRAAK